MQALAPVPGCAHRGSFERGESVRMTQVQLSVIVILAW